LSPTFRQHPVPIRFKSYFFLPAAKVIRHETVARKLFAANLWLERKARGLSQRALAQLAGLDRTYVGSVERGERNVSIDNVERLAEALGIELADLFKRIRP
jgi:ribosome-binding protein aMBF1 (putative translation factor)